jgi:uncharacterized membrane protein
MHIQNITFHILKSLLSLSPIGWFLLPYFLLVGNYIVITNMDRKKYANISLYYPHHEGA